MEEVEHIDAGSRSSKEQWTRKVDRNIGQFGVEIDICNHHREQGLISIHTILLTRVESAILQDSMSTMRQQVV